MQKYEHILMEKKQTLLLLLSLNLLLVRYCLVLGVCDMRLDQTSPNTIHKHFHSYHTNLWSWDLTFAPFVSCSLDYLQSKHILMHHHLQKIHDCVPWAAASHSNSVRRRNPLFFRFCFTDFSSMLSPFIE